LLPLSSAVLATLGSAAGSGLLASDAAAQVASRRSDDDAPPPLLVVPTPPILLAGHRSHVSHRSHYSSSGGRSRGSSPPPDSSEAPESEASPEQQAPPTPAHVVVVVYPGGKIFVDDKPVGQDRTGLLRLAPGKHEVRIVNRFLGEVTTTIEVDQGQTGSIPIHW